MKVSNINRKKSTNPIHPKFQTKCKHSFFPHWFKNWVKNVVQFLFSFLFGKMRFLYNKNNNKKYSSHLFAFLIKFYVTFNRSILQNSVQSKSVQFTLKPHLFIVARELHPSTDWIGHGWWTSAIKIIVYKFFELKGNILKIIKQTGLVVICGKLWLTFNKEKPLTFR